MTGLEPATSRPPAVRATNCATPRNLKATSTVMIDPDINQGGFSHAFASAHANIEIPIVDVFSNHTISTGRSITLYQENAARQS